MCFCASEVSARGNTGVTHLSGSHFYSMTIITYSFGFIVHVCSIIILDEITHMLGDYL